MNQLLYQFRYALPLWFVQLLSNWLPENRISMRLRGILVSAFVKRCGKNLMLGKNVSFYNPHGIVIGKDVYIAEHCWLDGIGGLEIEDEVKVSPFVVVTTSSHCFKDNSVRFAGSKLGSTRIGRGSWIASHAVLVAGTTVGKGTIIGANSVVTQDIPDNVFAAGSPARVIGPRPDQCPDIWGRFNRTDR